MNKEVDMGIDMYSFNRVNMGQLPYLETEEEIKGAKSIIKNYLKTNTSNYYMLLNHDNRDFTLFNFRENITDLKINTMTNDVIECMENRMFGLLDVGLDEAGCAIEVWVKDRKTEAVYMYLLFPYENGVIEY